MCLDFPSTRADITLPRADRDRLILVASFKRSPVAPEQEKWLKHEGTYLKKMVVK